MASGSGFVPVEALREAARVRVEESSLRVAAQEIGLSWKGLDLFIKGQTPYPSTVRKLTEWYLRRAVLGEEEPAAETIQAALALIVRHLPPAYQGEVQARVVELVRQIGREMNVSAPHWIED